MSDASTNRCALRIENLSRTFPGQRALDAVHFDLIARELHAPVGQNGSGKSTLIMVLAGFHEPASDAERTSGASPSSCPGPEAKRGGWTSSLPGLS
jgi:ABC-type sugar transport system ATPase subunit